jgi:tetratricopeptide (TPR) repeat protein
MERVPTERARGVVAVARAPLFRARTRHHRSIGVRNIRQGVVANKFRVPFHNAETATFRYSARLSDSRTPHADSREAAAMVDEKPIMKHARGPLAGVVVVVLVIINMMLCLLAGCASNGNSGGVTGLAGADADALDAQHSRFEAAEDPPLNAQTRFAAGQFAESQNATANAIAQYREAIKLDPNHQPSLYRLGILYAQVKDYPNAIATWKQYIEATGGSATGYGNLGFCHELASQTREAEDAYKTGISRNPNDQLCRVNYGLMLARLGRTNEAVLQLQAVLTPAEVHYNLASVYEQQEKIEQAKAEYRKALELDPTLYDAQTRMATIDAGQ